MRVDPKTLMELHENGELLGERGAVDIDWGQDADEVIEASGDLEHPESCESFQ